MSYRVCTDAPARLRWAWDGPAVHVVLLSPDGSVDGPGIGSSVTLPLKGCYVLSVSANTMGEGPYGPFRLFLSLNP